MMEQDAKRRKVAYLASLVEGGYLSCKEALEVSEETFGGTACGGLGFRISF